MSLKLHKRVALITGAGDGIGAGIAKRFAEEGAMVGVLDIRTNKVEQTCALINQQGGQAIPLVVDLRDEDQVNHAIDHFIQTVGRVDVLVNNAAIMPSGVLHQTSTEDWNSIFEVNVRGAFFASKAVIPSMLQQGKGCIIHMASVTGILGLPGLAAYSATKGALIALARAMSTDYASKGIRVNSVSPGTIDSPMLHHFLLEQKNPDSLRKEFDAMHPIGRVGLIDEVASVCAFLASDDASFVTGANYTVDGGLSVKGQQPQDNN
ncbi:MAG: SDR family NAD(P)-dependent oxidoreductase [Phototrophicaceae bacterium]